MQTFAELIRSWQIFYATLAAACATLVGLLFIALTVNPGTSRGGASSWDLRIARKTFGDFLLVLMTSLMFLVPGLPPDGLAVALVALGIAWIPGMLIRMIVGMARNGRTKVPLARRIRAFSLSLAGGVGLVVVGIALWLGYTDVLYWLVCVLAALLASAASTAWILLTRTVRAGVTRVRPGGPAGQRGS